LAQIAEREAFCGSRSGLVPLAPSSLGAEPLVAARQLDFVLLGWSWYDNRMATDPLQMELTPEQKERLAQLAEREGKDYREILDQLLTVAAPQTHQNGQGGDPSGPANLYEALHAIGAFGCFDGPEDLSTHPKHMEGFGTHAKRHAD